MNIEGLLSEIRTDPLGRGYAGMTRDQKWTSLNTVNRTSRVPVPAKSLAKWAASGGRIAAIADAQTTGATNAVKSAARYLMLLIGGFQTIDPDDSDDVGAVNALVTATVITAADRNALSALANVSVSRLTEIGNRDMPRAYFDYLLNLNGL